jgi:hypothetical protein
LKKILTSVLFALSIMGLIITLLIVYKNVDNPIATKFVIGYVVYLFLFILYYIVITVYNLGNIKWKNMKPRLIRFIKSFVFLSLLDLIFYLFKHPAGLSDIVKNVSESLALSVGSAFYDLPFLKKKTVKK